MGARRALRMLAANRHRCIAGRWVPSCSFVTFVVNAVRFPLCSLWQLRLYITPQGCVCTDDRNVKIFHIMSSLSTPFHTGMPLSMRPLLMVV